MAVYAAHLTRTLQGNPSIFQVSAQEALGSTVKPALKKLIEYLADAHPKRCGWCLEWFDELYLLFDFWLEYYYLKHYAASFSESFYGLLRVPLAAGEEFSLEHHRLPRRLERASLALLVLAPYLRDKAERLVQHWRDRREDGLLGNSAGDRCRAAAVRVFATAHLAYEASRVVQAARYLCGAAAPTPALALLALGLRDAPPRPDNGLSWADLFKSLARGRFGVAAACAPLVLSGALRVVEYGAFAVQLLRWWDARPGADHPLPAPPPPQKDERDERWQNKCPICLRTWKIPTALPVSGYIFCYICISRRLRATGLCPATGCPASERSLVRLYLD